MSQDGVKDVVIIGGGPAGAAAATWLAREGLHVCVLERTAFPRHHIGESLLGMSMPYLADLGVEDEIAAGGSLEKHGSLFRWGPNPDAVVLDMTRRAYQVKRAHFDDILLRNARRTGAEIRERHLVRRVVTEEGCARVVGTSPTGPFELRARAVVDASGLRQLVARQHGLALGVEGPKRLALSAYVSGARRPDQHHPNDIVTEACDDGWLWFIPLEHNLTSVGFVTDARGLSEPGASELAEQVRSTQLLRHLLADADLVTEVRALRYTNHILADSLWRDGRVVLVGDSGAFIDPLFSTGVHGALHSAALAAAGLVSVLVDGADAGSIGRWYDERVREHYLRVSAMVNLLYSTHPGPGPFWQSRFRQAVNDAEAADLANGLGPTGARFFRQAMRAEHLALPPRVVDLLRRYPSPGRPRALRNADVIDRRRTTRIERGLIRSAGRAQPSLLLVDALGLRAPCEWQEDSVEAQLVAAVDGRRSVGEIRRLCGVQGVNPVDPARFLGAVVAVGHLETVGANAAGGET